MIDNTHLCRLMNLNRTSGSVVVHSEEKKEREAESKAERWKTYDKD